MTEKRFRHGCLTAWLILMVVVNSFMSLAYLFSLDNIKQSMPNAPEWIFPVLTVCTVLNVVFALALFRWKRWGFWGMCATASIALGINITIGLGVLGSLGGIIGIVILFSVLHIGKERKAWNQLE